MNFGLQLGINKQTNSLLDDPRDLINKRLFDLRVSDKRYRGDACQDLVQVNDVTSCVKPTHGPTLKKTEEGDLPTAIAGGGLKFSYSQENGQRLSAPLALDSYINTTILICGYNETVDNHAFLGLVPEGSPRGYQGISLQLLDEGAGFLVFYGDGSSHTTAHYPFPDEKHKDLEVWGVRVTDQMDLYRSGVKVVSQRREHDSAITKLVLGDRNDISDATNDPHNGPIFSALIVDSALSDEAIASVSSAMLSEVPDLRDSIANRVIDYRSHDKTYSDSEYTKAKRDDAVEQVTPTHGPVLVQTSEPEKPSLIGGGGLYFDAGDYYENDEYIYHAGNGLTMLACIKPTSSTQYPFIFDQGFFASAGFGFGASTDGLFAYWPENKITTFDADLSGGPHVVGAEVVFGDVARLILDGEVVASSSTDVTEINSENAGPNSSFNGGPPRIGQQSKFTSSERGFAGELYNLLISSLLSNRIEVSKAMLAGVPDVRERAIIPVSDYRISDPTFSDLEAEKKARYSEKVALVKPQKGLNYRQEVQEYRPTKMEKDVLSFDGEDDYLFKPTQPDAFSDAMMLLMCLEITSTPQFPMLFTWVSNNLELRLENSTHELNVWVNGRNFEGVTPIDSGIHVVGFRFDQSTRTVTAWVDGEVDAQDQNLNYSDDIDTSAWGTHAGIAARPNGNWITGMNLYSIVLAANAPSDDAMKEISEKMRSEVIE